MYFAFATSLLHERLPSSIQTLTITTANKPLTPTAYPPSILSMSAFPDLHIAPPPYPPLQSTPPPTQTPPSRKILNPHP